MIFCFSFLYILILRKTDSEKFHDYLSNLDDSSILLCSYITQLRRKYLTVFQVRFRSVCLMMMFLIQPISFYLMLVSIYVILIQKNYLTILKLLLLIIVMILLFPFNLILHCILFKQIELILYGKSAFCLCVDHIKDNLEYI